MENRVNELHVSLSTNQCDQQKWSKNTHGPAYFVEL